MDACTKTLLYAEHNTNTLLDHTRSLEGPIQSVLRPRTFSQTLGFTVTGGSYEEDAILQLMEIRELAVKRDLPISDLVEDSNGVLTYPSAHLRSPNTIYELSCIVDRAHKIREAAGLGPGDKAKLVVGTPDGRGVDAYVKSKEALVAAISVKSGHPTGVIGGGYTGLAALQRGVDSGEVPQDTKFPSSRFRAAIKSAKAYHKKRLEWESTKHPDLAKIMGDDVVVLSSMPLDHISVISQDLVPREVARSPEYEAELEKQLTKASNSLTKVVLTPPGCMLGEDSVTTAVSEAMSTCPVNLDKGN